MKVLSLFLFTLKRSKDKWIEDVGVCQTAIEMYMRKMEKKKKNRYKMMDTRILFLIFLVCVAIIGGIVIGVFRIKEFYKGKNNRAVSSRVTTFCITLDDATERKEMIQNKFYPMGYDVQFIGAVDTRGDKWRDYSYYLTPDAITQIEKSLKNNKRDHHHELTPGAVGCFVSHIKCWNRFIATNPHDDDLLFVLEDDSVPISSFQREMKKVLAHFPSDTDIFLLSHITNGDSTEIKKKDFSFYKFNRYGAFYLTNAYIITGRGIKKIWNELSRSHFKFQKQIDSYLTELINNDVLVVYYTKTNICPQSTNTGTSIQTLPV